MSQAISQAAIITVARGVIIARSNSRTKEALPALFSVLKRRDSKL